LPENFCILNITLLKVKTLIVYLIAYFLRISFCYEPGLTKKYMPDPYVLHTDRDLDVSKKCGESFRGFKVALVKAKSHDKSYEQLFYEIQTGYENIP
jgi:hypothetical protein